MTAFVSLPTEPEFKNRNAVATMVISPPEHPMRTLVRRTMHGGTGWISGLMRSGGYQPQDQSLDLGLDLTEVQPTIVLGHREAPAGEPEDASLTGGTRSLMRRLSGLNVAVHRAKLISTAAPTHS